MILLSVNRMIVIYEPSPYDTHRASLHPKYYCVPRDCESEVSTVECIFTRASNEQRSIIFHIPGKMLVPQLGEPGISNV